MTQYHKNTLIVGIIIAGSLVTTTLGHTRTIKLQTPIWEQIHQLQCRERSRHVCYPEKLNCKKASGSAVWDINFSNNKIFSHTLNMSIAIKGYAHKYYDLLGTASNTAILSDGGLIDFYGFGESDVYTTRLRLLRNLAGSILQNIAGSIIVIDFECVGGN